MNYSNVIQLLFISIEQITFPQQKTKEPKGSSLPSFEQMALKTDFKKNNASMGSLYKMFRVMIHALQAFENAATACQTPGVTVRQSQSLG